MSKAPSQAGSSGAAANLGPSSSSSCSSPSAGGTTSPANVLHAQPEKPQHYTYVTKHLCTHLSTSADHAFSCISNFTRLWLVFAPVMCWIKSCVLKRPSSAIVCMHFIKLMFWRIHLSILTKALAISKHTKEGEPYGAYAIMVKVWLILLISDHWWSSRFVQSFITI